MKKLKTIDPDSHPLCKSKEASVAISEDLQKKMTDLLDLMYAHKKYSLLVILQGIDASGKDGAVKHVFSAANPQGLKVYSFKEPSPEELRHDFIWRCHLHAPESGLAVIFNRSYYEDVSKVMVHPELLKDENIPSEFLKDKNFFEERYDRINDLEKLLQQRGTKVVKFFFHISKDEQKKRLQDRLKEREKNWKFSDEDIKDRKHWAEYMKVYEKMIIATNTKQAPWHVVPANHKWYRNLVVSKVIVEALQEMKMSFPKVEAKIKKVH